MKNQKYAFKSYSTAIYLILMISCFTFQSLAQTENDNPPTLDAAKKNTVDSEHTATSPNTAATPPTDPATTSHPTADQDETGQGQYKDNPYRNQQLSEAIPLPSYAQQTTNQQQTNDEDKSRSQTTTQSPLADHPLNILRLPKKLAYIEGTQAPSHYVLQERPRLGLVITGAAVFGAIYGTCLLASVTEPDRYDEYHQTHNPDGSADNVLLESDDDNQLDPVRYLAIPIVGPIIWAAKKNDLYDQNDADANFQNNMLGTVTTLGQIAGVSLFILGMVKKKKRWIRRDLANLNLKVSPAVFAQKQSGLVISRQF